MRMWMVDPKLLCDQHLLGEHLECHMFRTTLLRKIGIEGYIKNRLLETQNVKSRHDELVREMRARYMGHYSPMEKFEVESRGSIDREKNLRVLSARCANCRKRIEKCRPIGIA